MICFCIPLSPPLTFENYRLIPFLPELCTYQVAKQIAVLFARYQCSFLQDNQQILTNAEKHACHESRLLLLQEIKQLESILVASMPSELRVLGPTIVQYLLR